MSQNAPTPEQRVQRYREAVAPHLGGEELEAAALFHRPEGTENDIENLTRGLKGIYEHLTKGRVGRLHGGFLLAVTTGKVHAFKYRESRGSFEVNEAITVFDRDEIRIREVLPHNYLYLEADENGRTRRISLDRRGVERNPGTAEVVAALSE